MIPVATSSLDIYVCLLLVLAGVGFNLLVKLAGLEEQGHKIAPWTYVAAHPYRSALLAVSTVLTMLLLYYLGELTYATCVLLGVASDQLADKLRAQASTRVDGGLGRLQ